MADPSRRNDARPTASELLRDAVRLNYLGEEEFVLFERLRRERNPYAHPRGALHRTTVIGRSVEAGTDPEFLLEEDAWASLEALVAS
jgi:hypothetical protein